MSDGTEELSAGLVKVLGIVCETWATGKQAVRIQEYKNDSVMEERSQLETATDGGPPMF